jgi:hypothetical protein
VKRTARSDLQAASLGAELPLVTLRAVDRYLIIDGKTRRPAALVLPRDAAALDAPGRRLVVVDLRRADRELAVWLEPRHAAAASGFRGGEGLDLNDLLSARKRFRQIHPIASDREIARAADKQHSKGLLLGHVADTTAAGRLL